MCSIANSVAKSCDIRSSDQIFGSGTKTLANILSCDCLSGWAMMQVWALGCVLYSLIVGKLPFDGQDKAEQVYNILNKQLKFPSRIRRDPELLDLLMRMLDRSPRHRITVDEALKHPWVRHCLLAFSHVDLS